MAAILDLLKPQGCGPTEMFLVFLNLALYQVWHFYPPGKHNYTTFRGAYPLNYYCDHQVWRLAHTARELTLVVRI